MVKRVIDGLLFEALSPSVFHLRLNGEGSESDPIILSYGGVVWSARFADTERDVFLSRGEATKWLRQKIELTETKYKITFACIVERK